MRIHISSSSSLSSKFSLLLSQWQSPVYECGEKIIIGKQAHIQNMEEGNKKYTRIMLAFNSPNCRDINDFYTHLNHNSIQFELVFIPMQCFMFSIRFLFFHVSFYICVVVVLRMCIYVVFFFFGLKRKSLAGRHQRFSG